MSSTISYTKEVLAKLMDENEGEHAGSPL